MDNGNKNEQNNKTKKTVSQILCGIFFITMYICATVLFIINFFFSGEKFEPNATIIAFVMWIVPTVYFALSIIVNAFRK